MERDNKITLLLGASALTCASLLAVYMLGTKEKKGARKEVITVGYWSIRGLGAPLVNIPVISFLA